MTRGVTAVANPYWCRRMKFRENVLLAMHLVVWHGVAWRGMVWRWMACVGQKRGRCWCVWWRAWDGVVRRGLEVYKKMFVC